MVTVVFSLKDNLYDRKRFHRLRSHEGRLVARHRGHVPPASLILSDDVDYYRILGFSPYGFEE